MRPYQLFAISFLAAFGVGFCKFFAITHLSEELYGLENKGWIVQVVGAMMTLGPVMAYPLASRLTACYRKSNIIVLTSLAVMGVISFVFLAPYPLVIWLGLYVMGFMTGLLSSSKMSTVALEGQSGRMSITTVNAGMTITFIFGMIGGVVAGTSVALRFPAWGYAIAVGSFALTALLAFSVQFKHEILKSASEVKGTLLEGALELGSAFPVQLSVSPLLWGIASALSLSATAYAEVKGLGSAEACSLMSLFAVCGSIIGNVISTKVQSKQHAKVTLAILLMTILVTAIIPLVSIGISLGSGYGMLSVCMIVMGACFGFATNLLDAEYLKGTADLGMEGQGASLQSMLVGLGCFIVGGTTGLLLYLNALSLEGQFLLFTLLSAIAFVGMACSALAQGDFNLVIRSVLVKMVKRLLGLRYHVQVEGLENIPKDDRGVLVLPNHPAEIDPVIITTACSERCHLHPIVIENFFHMKGIAWVMKLMGALPMPDLGEGGSTGKMLRMARSFVEAKQLLKNGEALLMYPAGQLMKTGREHLGANSGVAKLLEGDHPPHVIAIRTTGLWGSSFSKAKSGGQTPDLFESFKQGLIHTLKNGIFFNPRRDVHVNIQRMENLEGKSIAEINSALTEFYNANGEEAFKHVPLSRSGADLEWTPKEKQLEEEQELVWDETIAAAFALRFELKADDLRPQSRLEEDLGMDSISRSECILWLEEEYDRSNISPQDLDTLSDMISLIQSKASEQDEEGPDAANQSVWGEAPHLEPQLVMANSCPEAFLRCCDRLGELPVTADPITGVMSAKRFKIAALMMAKTFSRWPEQRIGLMLPASNGAAICTMAMMLAGKTPVMLNWTVGKRNLEHAFVQSELKRVVTSEAFLNKLQHVELGSLADALVTLEDLKAKHWNLGAKIAAALKAQAPTSLLLKRLRLDELKGKEEAVLLFTSGSEQNPKGVPLSHANLMSNISGAMDAVEFSNSDVMYGFLPPFHSFGLTVTTLLPLLGGVRVAFHPNPTEYRSIARGCQSYQISRLCGTPTFVNGILNAAKAGQVDSIKTFVVGAERMPAALAQRVRNLNTGAEILEGYGITECSPVLTINRPGQSPEGVGAPLASVTLKVVDIDTHQDCPQGERGLVLAKGPSIFSGYLGGAPNPFVEVDGELWYNTGDLGIMNASGQLTLAGRMKRFVKIAGEMVSLPAMEAALAEMDGVDEDGPFFALHAKEREGERPVLTLFSTMETELEAINAHLRKSGFANVCKVHRLECVKELPMLGTGKVNLGALDKMAKALEEKVVASV